MKRFRTLAVGLGIVVAAVVSSAAPAIAGSRAELKRLEQRVRVLKGLEQRVRVLEALLASVSLVDGPAGPKTLLRLTGVNLQVVDGSGDTDGATNGLGNVLIGYGEGDCALSVDLCSVDGDCPVNVCSAGLCSVDGIVLCTTDADCMFNSCTVPDLSGSHNIVVGTGHTATSFAGLVAGAGNRVTGPGASVTGGTGNAALGVSAAVCGGFGNTASGPVASVTGGVMNTANGVVASVSGGLLNVASGLGSSVSGGFQNTAIGAQSSVSGGRTNQAGGDFSVVVGGNGNSTTTADAIVP